MKLLVIDTENYDPLLKTYGCGAVFKYNYPEVEFECILVGTIDCNLVERVYILPQEKEALYECIHRHDSLLFHNSLYDLCVLRYLYRDIDFDKFLILDTMVEAALDDQHIKEKIILNKNYTVEQRKSPGSLDTLTKFYGVLNKQTDILLDYAWSSGIYQEYIASVKPKHKDGSPAQCLARPTDKVLKEWCYGDLRRFPINVLSEYCMVDVRATLALHNKIYPNLSYLDMNRFSQIILVCLDAKFYGIRIDLKRLKELDGEWTQLAVEARNKFIAITNSKQDINLNSPQQLVEVFHRHGFKLPKTAKGGDSVTNQWLEKQPHEFCKQLVEYKKCLSMKSKCLNKLLGYQQAIPEKYRNSDVGWLYPSLCPLGAVRTGRFSGKTGYKSMIMDVLVVPRRDEKFGKPIRELFIAHENEQLICMDFSNQEQRLQVHCAYMLKCKGVQKIVDRWNETPELKYYSIVADMTKLDYERAKAVTLGISFGQGSGGLSHTLGIKTYEAQGILAQYHSLLPFISELQQITSQVFLRNGYIKTIGGRKLHIQPAYEWKGKLRTGERDALSRYSQGSGADMEIDSCIAARKRGIKVLLPVHDEIVATSEDVNRDMPILKECMENCYKLVIPVVVDGGYGRSWGEAK